MNYMTPDELRRFANSRQFRFGCYSVHPDYMEDVCQYCRMDSKTREYDFCVFSLDYRHQVQKIDNLERCPFMEAAQAHRESLRNPDRGIMDYDVHHSLADLIAQGIIEDPGRVEMGRV